MTSAEFEFLTKKFIAQDAEVKQLALKCENLELKYASLAGKVYALHGKNSQTTPEPTKNEDIKKEETIFL